MKRFNATGRGRRKSEASSTSKNTQPVPCQQSAERSLPSLPFPDGIKVLHECLDATVDICFIHGLTGDRDSTWTAHGQSIPWPKMLLPSELSTARIITWGYDAYIVRESVAGSNRLIDHATNLLHDLATDRARHHASSRMLIFIAHSLGGLVCKKAILLSRNHPEAHLQSIFNCTKGVIFMGTPHKGSWMADWAKIPAGALGLVKSANKSLLDILKTDNQLLEAIQVEFWSMIREQREKGRSFEVTCFFEELSLPAVGKVVSKDSATLEGYNQISIHADHSNMVKFLSVDDNGYKRLLGELARWEQGTSTAYNVDDRDRQCLNDLWASDPKNEKTRIQDTKGSLLKDVYSWILENRDFEKWRDSQDNQLLWIRGDPGKGKTMLLCGIIDELNNSTGKSGILAFFFCQATDSRFNNATAVLRSLIRQLVDQQPSLTGYIRKRYDTYKDMFSWYDLSEIFTNMLKYHVLKKTFLVVDGLDECQDGLINLISMIMQKWSSHPHVKWVVSSRNWPSIKERLNYAGQLSLELNAESVFNAVGLYIKLKVRHLVELKNYDSRTENTVRQYLCENSKGTFLWVALVCQYLETIQLSPLIKMKSFPPGLDSLYERMLQDISESDDCDFCQKILGLVTTVYRPITLMELSCFIDIEDDVPDKVELLGKAVSLCGSFLAVREETVYFVHQSAQEFLIKKASNKVFPSGIEVAHHAIFLKSLQAIAGTLQRDIYGLGAPGFPISQVRKPAPDPLASAQYACVYWVDHLEKCSPSKNAYRDLRDNGSVDMFFRQDYLHWLEALSLLRSLPEGVASILKLRELLKTTTENSALISRVQDAYRFIRYHQVIIEHQPLQVYYSGLIFSPARSITRNQFQGQEPGWIIKKPEVEESWSACLQTLEGHRLMVNSAVFSHDSKLLASASGGDGTVKIWDANSGRCLHTLEGHRSAVNSAVFSHDSKLLASASGDGTVKIWDANSRRCLQTLEGHRSAVNSAVFSHDSKLLASASNDGAVKVWDAGSGQCLQTLDDYRTGVNSGVFCHPSRVLGCSSLYMALGVCDKCPLALDGHYIGARSVAFSHDSKRLAFASSNRIIKIWNTNRWKCLQTLEGHHSWINSVVFSHDSKLLASASDDMTIKIWDTNSWKCLQTLESHYSMVNSVVFSHNSKVLASALADRTIKIWDVNSWKCIQTLESHSSWINSVVFSHDSKLLASASNDATVKIWDMNSKQCLRILEGYQQIIWPTVFSNDSKLLASASDNTTVKIWDTNSWKCLQILQGHQKIVTPIIFSHNSKLLASALYNETINVWNVNNGKCLQTLEGHHSSINSMAFSHDSKLLASASVNETVKIWNINSGKCLRTLKGYHIGINSTIFSYNLKLIAFASTNRIIKIWNTNSWKCLRILKGHHRRVNSVAFSYDSELLASASDDETVKIWNTNSWKCLRTLNHHASVDSAVFSHDSKLIASYDGAVKVWDAGSGQCLQTLELYNISSIKFDTTNAYLETNRGTIRLFLNPVTGSFKTNLKIPQFQGLSISLDNTWITWNSEKLLWLPPEYRPGHQPSSYIISLSSISIHCVSGRVLILKFDSRKLLQCLAM